MFSIEALVEKFEPLTPQKYEFERKKHFWDFLFRFRTVTQRTKRQIFYGSNLVQTKSVRLRPKWRNSDLFFPEKWIATSGEINILRAFWYTFNVGIPERQGSKEIYLV